LMQFRCGAVLDRSRFLGQTSVRLLPCNIRPAFERGPAGLQVLPDSKTDCERDQRQNHQCEQHTAPSAPDLIYFRVGCLGSDQYQSLGYHEPPFGSSAFAPSSVSVKTALLVSSGVRLIANGVTSKNFIALPSSDSSSTPDTNPAPSSRCK